MRLFKAIAKIPFWELLVLPACTWCLGAFLNVFVIAMNKGQMPVLWPGGCSTWEGDDADIMIHRCMIHADKLKFLCDWIVINGYGIASPGDILLWASMYYGTYCYILWAFLTFKDLKE